MRQFITILFSVIFFTSFSCKEEAKQKPGLVDKEQKSQDCIQKKDMESIIYEILNTDYVMSHLDPRVKKGDLALKLLSNDYITSNLVIEFHQNQVEILDSTKLTDDMVRIAFSNKNCKQKELNFMVTYPIEGKWYASGNVSFINDQWVADIHSGGISD